MKLIWSPETASKAYFDTVKSCELNKDSGVAELISAMAAGWKAKLIVETWQRGGAIATSVGLAVASRHGGGRHICIVPDEESRADYIAAMEKAYMSSQVVVGEAEVVVESLEGIDFLVVDCRQNDSTRVLRVEKLGQRGAVLVCKNANSRSATDFRWQSVVDDESRIVRSMFLPVGKGLDIVHVAARGSSGAARKGESRWIKSIDRESGEEFVIRK
ncbi:hypothetical protein Fot_08985 [Forsythia ovata]|uniref:Uncharacterized protein n=1 Tax=Forsythia ovata TaxID=205694 RepID=A0ABD1WCQ7_9LAMI